MGESGSVVGWGTMLQAGMSLFESWWGDWIFNKLNSHYGPGVDSASNINEYQESSWNLPGGKGGRGKSLTTLPSFVSRLFRKCGRLDVSEPNEYPRPVTGISFLLYYQIHNAERANEDRLVICFIIFKGFYTYSELRAMNKVQTWVTSSR
jgi:hypothetical protein